MNELPAYRITRDNGTSYITSMAKGITLEQAYEYFMGQKQYIWNGEKEVPAGTVVSVEKA